MGRAEPLAACVAWLFVILWMVPSCEVITSGTWPGHGEDSDAQGTPVEPESASSGYVRAQAQPVHPYAQPRGGQINIAGGVYSPSGSVEATVATGLVVLLILANHDFHFGEYLTVRHELELQGHRVIVAAPKRQIALPQLGTAPAGTGAVMPDIGLDEIQRTDASYDALVLIGGWGAVSLFSGFNYIFDNYSKDSDAGDRLNALIAWMQEQNKWIAAIGFGVGVLAWSRLDELSPLAGRKVAASRLVLPAVTIDDEHYGDGKMFLREHLESNGAILMHPVDLGNPTIDADDFVLDGAFLTAAQVGTARQFAKKLGELLDP